MHLVTLTEQDRVARNKFSLELESTPSNLEWWIRIVCKSEAAGSRLGSRVHGTTPRPRAAPTSEPSIALREDAGGIPMQLGNADNMTDVEHALSAVAVLDRSSAAGATDSIQQVQRNYLEGRRLVNDHWRLPALGNKFIGDGKKKPRQAVRLVWGGVDGVALGPEYGEGPGATNIYYIFRDGAERVGEIYRQLAGGEAMDTVWDGVAKSIEQLHWRRLANEQAVQTMPPVAIKFARVDAKPDEDVAEAELDHISIFNIAWGGRVFERPGPYQKECAAKPVPRLAFTSSAGETSSSECAAVVADGSALPRNTRGRKAPLREIVASEKILTLYDILVSKVQNARATHNVGLKDVQVIQTRLAPRLADGLGDGRLSGHAGNSVMWRLNDVVAWVSRCCSVKT